MKIGIKKENGLIYIQGVTSEKQEKQLAEQPFNFKIIDIGEAYSDCQGTDFNDDLTFNVDKYNARKGKIVALEKIAELKQKLFDTDYQVLKWKENELTDYEFEPMRLQRKAWREEIRELEKLI